MKRYGSLTSPRVKRISGSKNFRSPPQKDFCNNIGTKRKSETGWRRPLFGDEQTRASVPTPSAIDGKQGFGRSEPDLCRSSVPWLFPRRMRIQGTQLTAAKVSNPK